MPYRFYFYGKCLILVYPSRYEGQFARRTIDCLHIAQYWYTFWQYAEHLSSTRWQQQCNYDSIKLPNKKQLHCPEYCFLINAGSLSYSRSICHDVGPLLPMQTSPRSHNFIGIENKTWRAWSPSSCFWTSLCFIPCRRDKKYNEVDYKKKKLDEFIEFKDKPTL